MELNPLAGNRRGLRVLGAAAMLAMLSVVVAAASSRADKVGPLWAVVPQVAPACSALPSPESDTWPVASADLLGPTSGSLTFAGSVLLANDTGVAPLTASIPAESTPLSGGTITGTDPFTYTPGPLFVGTDVFTYEVSDGSGRTSIGLVKVTVAADDVAPVVSITSPAGGTVSGTVVVTAAASDNVGVVGVRFMDGATQIGQEVTSAPASTSWDTTLVSDGVHTLTAIARDAAGNTATSAPVVVTVDNSVPPPPPPTVETVISSDGLNRRTTRPFSTSAPGAVIVAFVAAGGPAAANAQMVAVSGAGLTWSRVQRAATSFGDSEIWTATASGVLTNVTVSSTPSLVGYRQSLTVVVFSGASGIGAAGSAAAANGAPSVSLVTQGPNSLVYAVGNDWDSATARVLPEGQTKVHELLERAAGDTFWVQALSSPVTGPSAVTLNATAPTTDQWNMAAVEIRPAAAVPAIAARGAVDVGRPQRDTAAGRMTGEEKERP